MFDVSKDFYTEKAYKLLNQYEEKQYYSKAKFLYALINSQLCFSSGKSILDCKLILNGCYRKRTIELVLDDLNYSLIEYSVLKNFSCLGKPKKNSYFTIIKFTYDRG